MWKFNRKNDWSADCIFLQIQTINQSHHIHVSSFLTGSKQQLRTHLSSQFWTPQTHTIFGYPHDFWLICGTNTKNDKWYEWMHPYLTRGWTQLGKPSKATSSESWRVGTSPDGRRGVSWENPRSRSASRTPDKGDWPSFSSLNKDRWRQQREKKEIKQSTPGYRRKRFKIGDLVYGRCI